ncbi:MAG: hypothetical protein EOQ40_17555 [Mesorhizobium sp.]|nr:MAG: hypothetical protein EOQ40_17555 [Mesorhizobium sp.]
MSGVYQPPAVACSNVWAFFGQGSSGQRRSKVSKQRALNLIGRVGLREMTGRGGRGDLSAMRWRPTNRR